VLVGQARIAIEDGGKGSKGREERRGEERARPAM